MTHHHEMADLLAKRHFILLKGFIDTADNSLHSRVDKVSGLRSIRREFRPLGSLYFFLLTWGFRFLTQTAKKKSQQIPKVYTSTIRIICNWLITMSYLIKEKHIHAQWIINNLSQRRLCVNWRTMTLKVIKLL